MRSLFYMNVLGFTVRIQMKRVALFWVFPFKTNQQSRWGRNKLQKRSRRCTPCSSQYLISSSAKLQRYITCGSPRNTKCTSKRFCYRARCHILRKGTTVQCTDTLSVIPLRDSKFWEKRDTVYRRFPISVCLHPTQCLHRTIPNAQSLVHTTMEVALTSAMIL